VLAVTRVPALAAEIEYVASEFEEVEAALEYVVTRAWIASITFPEPAGLKNETKLFDNATPGASRIEYTYVGAA